MTHYIFITYKILCLTNKNDNFLRIFYTGKEGNINTIKGIQRNVKGLGLCFEKKVFDERLQIPIDFIQKFGFYVGFGGTKLGKAIIPIRPKSYRIW